MTLTQSPPSQSQAELLQLASQYLSLIQLGGQPSAQLGTGQDKYTYTHSRGRGRGRGRGETVSKLAITLATPPADLLTPLVSVEVLGPHVVSEHDIIVEVDEVVGQSWDTVQVTLYSGGTVGGQVGVVWENILQQA